MTIDTTKPIVLLTLVLCLTAGNAQATGGGGGGADIIEISKDQIAKGIQRTAAGAHAAVLRQITAVAVAVTKSNAAAAGLGITKDEIDACLNDDNAACQVLFKKLMRNLSKILTANYRMAQSIHIFNPNATRYSKQRAKSLAMALADVRR